MSASNELRDALSAPAYEAAFTKAMTGSVVDWTDEERDAVRLVRRLAGTSGHGYLMPWRLDPTRPAEEAPPQ